MPTATDAFDTLPVTVFEADATGTLVYLNRAAFDLFGFDPEDLHAGRLRATQLVTEEDAVRVRENLRRLATGALVGPQHYTARLAGRDLPVVVFSRPINRSISERTSARSWKLR